MHDSFLSPPPPLRPRTPKCGQTDRLDDNYKRHALIKARQLMDRVGGVGHIMHACIYDPMNQPFHRMPATFTHTLSYKPPTYPLWRRSLSIHHPMYVCVLHGTATVPNVVGPQQRNLMQIHCNSVLLRRELNFELVVAMCMHAMITA